MATITNLSTSITITITDNTHTSYDIAPLGVVNIPNYNLDYSNFSSAVARGIISVVGWSSPTSLSPGIGSFAAVPAGTTNGTAIGSPPVGASGVRMYFTSGDSVTFTISNTAPTGTPTLVFTAGLAATGPNWDEDLSNGANIYVTAKTGSPIFRWF